MVVWQETAGSSLMYNGSGPYGAMAEDWMIQRHV